MKGKATVNADMIDPRVLRAYDRWVVKHFDELVRKYPRKVIAVYGGKLVVVGDSYKEVYAAARLALSRQTLAVAGRRSGFQKAHGPCGRAAKCLCRRAMGR